MDMQKRNCWEIKKCGRELGGQHAFELGVCPAATDVMLDSVHGGKNGGRACWVVSGTMCDGRIHGDFAEKLNQCSKCEVYEQIKKEEGTNFQTTVVLLEKVAD
jgi:hypothetical protein